MASACLGTFGLSLFNVLNYIVCLRITEEGSVPEMRIWSILLIKSDLNGVYILVEVSFYIWTRFSEAKLLYVVLNGLQDLHDSSTSGYNEVGKHQYGGEGIFQNNEKSSEVDNKTHM